MDVPVLGIVENMSYLEMEDGALRRIFGEGGGEKLAQMAGAPLLSSLPIDENIRVGGDQGAPVVVAEPESPGAKAFDDLAQSIAARMSMEILQ
jgi:ATP-binding protein involved in chromosome partitioning